MGLSIVTIFCKVPRAGEVKTRLVPPLTFGEAADLARAFVRDLSAVLADLPGGHLEIALPPGAEPADLHGVFEAEPRYVEQGPGNLGERLARTTTAAFARGAGRAGVVGSDHPNLPLEFVTEMFEIAKEGQVGWVPTEDGGFAAMTLPRSLPVLFDDVPWSTPRVADAIRSNAVRCGVKLVDLGPWYDVDTVHDLRRLAHDLESTDGCPATRAVLATLRPPLVERGLPTTGRERP